MDSSRDAFDMFEGLGTGSVFRASVSRVTTVHLPMHTWHEIGTYSARRRALQAPGDQLVRTNDQQNP